MFVCRVRSCVEVAGVVREADEPGCDTQLVSRTLHAVTPHIL